MQNQSVFVKMFDTMGRGVTTSLPLAKGEFVAQCELLVLSSKDTKVVNQTDLQYYTFKYNEDSDCLVLGIGEIFNHDGNPNVRYDITDYTQDGYTRKVMTFTTTREIAAGEQLFIDYTADTNVDARQYIANASLLE